MDRERNAVAYPSTGCDGEGASAWFGVHGNSVRHIDLVRANVSVRKGHSGARNVGTGYSSLAYLCHFPLDALKIDRSFLLEMTNGTVTPLVETVIRLAHGLGLQVVAEGVENERQLGALRRAGCDRLQGHLFGQPLPADAVSDFLLRQKRIAALAPVN